MNIRIIFGCLFLLLSICFCAFQLVTLLTAEHVAATPLVLQFCSALACLLLASLAGGMVEKSTGGQWQLALNGWVWLLGIVAIVLMSLAVGLLPGLRARRLRIVDALAGR